MKSFTKFFNDNIYLFLGILIGLYISSILEDTFDVDCKPKHVEKRNETDQQLLTSLNKSLPLVTMKKKVTNDPKKKVIRPRYYSTELGIRDKMFVGIFTSEEKVNTQAVHLNKTIGHLADKIKFFITAQYKLKDKFNLTGLVGFTDARQKYRPFQVIKYVSDSFSQDYDYFFFTHSHTFVNIHKLKDIVKKISVTMDVYLGTSVPDSSYCNMDAGVVISNSALQAMRRHLDWCILNAVSDDYSENFGRCIYHSLGLTCQEKLQGESLTSFKLKHFELNPHLLDLTKKEEFNKAVTVYPVLQKEDLYLLNAYFLRQRLSETKNNIDKLSKLLTDSWPPGQRLGAKPLTRFDLTRQNYFNMTHVYHPDDFTIVRPHTRPELQDIEYIVDEVKAKIERNNSRKLTFRRLINGYKKFDLSRGMDYVLDIGLRDLTTGKEVIKRFEVSKPLGSVEFIPVPYVTENTRVTILLPVQEVEVKLAENFLNHYLNVIMDRKEKTFLMLVFLYQSNTESKGEKDTFNGLKNAAVRISNKYKNEDMKIAWVSIRLPGNKTVLVEDNPVLNFATVDLALKKVGLDSLMLLLDVYCNITGDFLNRVRMNTIQNFQIFNPIPFRFYNKTISLAKFNDVHKNVGHFDREEYKYVSFYGRDYVSARKKYQHMVPLTRVDEDIATLLKDSYRQFGNIFEMFLKFADHLHCMRATEMSLKIVYHEDLGKCNWFWGNEGQLARLLLTKQDQISELNA